MRFLSEFFETTDFLDVDERLFQKIIKQFEQKNAYRDMISAFYMLIRMKETHFLKPSFKEFYISI